MPKPLSMFNVIFYSLISLFIYSNTFATEKMKTDSNHIRIWNKFANDTLLLHKKLTDGKKFQVKSQVGGYANTKDFYTENRYYDKERLISQLQWEKNDPSTLHTIEVFVHDSKGRVTRDYMAAYLPFYHNAPTQTLISIHYYVGKLHVFRSFDASGDLVLERCSGKNEQGQDINLLLDEDDLINDPDDLIGSKDYNSCFDGFKQETLGKYILPQ